MSRDPVGEEGGRNLQGFVDNDPANALDPRGESLITYCCPQDDPLQPEKSCEEICQMARNLGIEGDELTASVVCYGHGKQCPCLLTWAT